MNKSELIGRLTKDPDIRRGKEDTAIARFVLAVRRSYRKEDQPDADFIPCVAVGKRAEFVEKYFCKGLRVSVVGHIQTGSYVNKDGHTVYTTEIFAEELESLEKLPNREESAGSRETDTEPYPGTADMKDYEMEFPFN